jgi:UDP-2-acetamido-3-amino-2,3-dideoxy-glucuronate N-acetyltransferase
MSFFKHETAVVDAPVSIGDETKIWHFSHIMSGAVIGSNCILGQNVFVAASVVLGNRVKVQNNVSLFDGVFCADDVFIGPGVVFTNITNPRSFIERKHAYKKTIVQQGASIGANATILCGNTIGSFALIGAGAVVTRNVAPYALITGNPGKQTGWVSEAGNVLQFDETGFAVCSETGESYQLKNKRVEKTGNNN